MTDIRDRLVGVLCDRLADLDVKACRYLAEQLADTLLQLPDVAVVELPEPEYTTSDIEGDGLRIAHFPHDISAWGGKYPGVMDCDADMSIEVARSLAASLLAAANFADTQEVTA